MIGYLEGGFESWLKAGKPVDLIERIDATEFSGMLDVNTDTVFDIRREGEYAAEHIENAYNKPLLYINDWIKDINPDEHFFVHCAGGYRSMIAASILQARGYRNFTEIAGGYKAIAETNIPLTDFVCPTKTLKL